jgi:MYXO-CTERM domain-containing protein
MSAGTYSVAIEVSIIGDAKAQITPAISVDLCAPSNENNEGGTTNGATTNNTDEGGPTEGDGGCSSSSGNTGLLALFGLVGFFRRRR